MTAKVAKDWSWPCLDSGFQYALMKKTVKKIWDRILNLAWHKLAMAALMLASTL